MRKKGFIAFWALVIGALFVVPAAPGVAGAAEKGDPIVLVLNTGRQEDLKPKKLYIDGESLYVRLGNERVKFSENALLSIAEYLEDDDEGHYYIKVKGRKYRIPEGK